jgi:DNA (cytosine-5)-methyltransferase 1
MAGIDTIAAVEFDTNNQRYSQDCQQLYSINFPGCHFHLKSVQEVAKSLPKCDILQASPVCSNFSRAKCNRVESPLDLEMTQATIDAIASTRPRYFMLENVPDYSVSKSFNIIVEFLSNNNYLYDYKIIDMSDYGIPQNRKRLILLAGLGKFWSFPKEERTVGWLEAIAGTKLVPTDLTDRQLEVASKYLKLGENTPDFLIQRTGSRAIRLGREPAWTLTKSMFTDGRANARSNILNCYVNGQAYSLSMRAIARLCGFPDWFSLDSRSVGQGLGYAVPPYFVSLCGKQIFTSKNL